MPARNATKKSSTLHTVLQALFVVTISVSILITALNIITIRNKKPEIIEVETISAEIKHWQEVLRDHPTYRDAYLNLAMLYKQKGNLDAARSLVKTAQKIDPTSQKVYEYGQVLGISTF